MLDEILVGVVAVLVVALGFFIFWLFKAMFFDLPTKPVDTEKKRQYLSEKVYNIPD